MGSFTIDFRPSAEKELRKLPPYIIRRISNAIDDLADNPFPPNTVKLTGKEEAFRIRAGDYRVVYVLDASARRVTIQRIRHRKDIYRQF